MGADFSSLEQCKQLREVHIAEAAKSSDAMRALLKRFAEIAAPGKGAPVIVAALARLGTTACGWIDGELRVEISGDAAKTTIAVASSLGAGFHEKVFPDTTMPVPFEEFRRGVQRAPKLLDPLVVLRNDERLLVLAAAAEVRMSTAPPNQIDPSSMFKLPAPPSTPSLPMEPPAVALPTKK